MDVSRAIVMAAGEGSRLRPLTVNRPKCCIPVAGKPLIKHVLDNLKAAGLREAIVIVDYHAEKVREALRDYSGLKISFVQQERGYGTGAALLSVKDKVSGPVFVCAGDIVTESNAVKKVIYEHSGALTIGLKEVPNPSQYGVAVLSGSSVTGFEEKSLKPSSNLANTSLYVAEPSFFKELDGIKPSPRGELELTCAIKSMASRNRVTGVRIKDRWIDVGNPWQVLEANEFLLSSLKTKKLGKVSNSTLKGPVFVEKGAEVFDSYIEGPAYVCSGAKIGPFAYIRASSSIGPFCSIGGGTTVKNSVLFDKVNAKHLAYIGDSVVGSRCNFGSGTQTANYRFDSGTVSMTIRNARIDSGRKKLGCVLGDEVKTGVLSCIMPGRVVGNNCWVGAGVVLSFDLVDNERVFIKQSLDVSKGVA